MFVLPSILVGLAVAFALGGRPSRLVELQIRAPWLVLCSLGMQVVLFSGPGSRLGERAADVAHISSYVLLIVFGLLNLRIRALWLLLTGMILNAITVAANGGEMPLSAEAARAAGIASGNNVDTGAERLRFLGDVFALPSELPFANAFSLGDLLIGVGMVLLIVRGSVDSANRPMLRLARLRAPLRSSDFRALAGGRLVSACGDWLTTAALIGWLYDDTGSTLWVAALLLLRMAPPILGGSIAALVADRLSKRHLLVGVELARCAVVLSALAAAAGGSRVGVLACVGVSGALAALTSSVVPALVPALVPERRYAAANAVLGVIDNVGMAAGALCGALALRQLGASGALALDAGSFLVAATLYLRIRATTVTASDEPTERGSLRYLLSHRRLAAALGCFAAAIVATGLANATLPRLLGDDLAVGPGAYGFGIAAIGVGLMLGQLGVGLSRIGDQGMRWLGTALALMAGLFALLALVDHAPTAFLFLAAIGFVDGTTDGVFDTVVQREAPSTRHGAVFGLASATFAGAMMASVALAPALNQLAGASVVIGAGAFALLAASTIAFAGARDGAVGLPRPRARRRRTSSGDGNEEWRLPAGFG